MSEEKSKLSLRSGPKRNKGKPVISAPKPISGPIPQDGFGLPKGPIAGKAMTLGPPPAAPASSGGKLRPPPLSGSKTSDLVKRRYSTRFGPVPGEMDGAAALIPPIPAMPALSQLPIRSTLSRTESAPPAVDVNMLRDPGLNASQYVGQVLGDATDDEIRDFETQLQALRSRAASDLQHNVYQNRSQFIKISKEAEKLKAEMRTLKTLMAELKTNVTALRSAASSVSGDGGFSTGLSKRDKRSSVMDRSLMWQTQMQVLYKNVEGSQKFLPATLGRHIIQDAGVWIELDNATYKSRRLMHVYLLNDHLLVASRRKRKGDVQGVESSRMPLVKQVADRCWPLLDIEVIDMAGTGESSGKTKLADAIMVRGVGQESVIYRTEKPEEGRKKPLMLNIRKAVEELRRGVQSERDAHNKARETMIFFASRDPGLLKTKLLPDLTDIKDAPIEVDGGQQNIRWVESQMDELDIDIALQKIESAVAKVEHLLVIGRQQKNTIVQKLFQFKTGERAAKLAELLTRELVETHNEATKTRNNVQWLTRLGFEDWARTAYLEARSAIIQQRRRQCIFDGDLHRYIWQLSFIYFTIIRNTVVTFHSCFPQSMMSALVKWAKEQVEAFNVILGRQLSGIEEGSEAWTQCIQQAKNHAKMLSEVGLDFENLVGRIVTETGTLKSQ